MTHLKRQDQPNLHYLWLRSLSRYAPCYTRLQEAWQLMEAWDDRNDWPYSRCNVYHLGKLSFDRLSRGACRKRCTETSCFSLMSIRVGKLNRRLTVPIRDTWHFPLDARCFNSREPRHLVSASRIDQAFSGSLSDFTPLFACSRFHTPDCFNYTALTLSC